MSDRNIAGLIEDLNGKTYIGRMSKTLYDKLINYNKSENTIEHILFRNIISAIDNLENHSPLMKVPGDLKGILTDYKHAHFSDTTAVAFFNNYAKANGKPPGSFHSVEDISAFIIESTQPHELQNKIDEFHQCYIERMKSGEATGDWLLYIEREEKKYYLDTHKHILRKNNNDQIKLKQHLDSILASLDLPQLVN
ncbi:hypothetical protein HRD68_00885 (plasmid) [Yersinia massiliensis]|uniref:hypothetical protein n=1 Tax=Yersinia massiliensis TaxID=419257 RepID=UPI0015626EDC|nr:hypothetical protein [Yersinia massiliensis]QKJ09412.1 hypothetical protein HRD68_00885 [Yersinia massiliensis]